MIQPGKSFLKFDGWLNKACKKYEDLISNNDIFVFHAYQSEKHYKMNSKQNPTASVIFKVIFLNKTSSLEVTHHYQEFFA